MMFCAGLGEDMRTPRIIGALIFASSAMTSPLVAQSLKPSLMDSFRIGSGGGALCQAQSKSSDPAISGIFDRAWTLVCRDATQPVGQVFALRGDSAAIDTRISSSRPENRTCGSWTTASIEGLAGAQQASCDGGYVAYKYTVGKVTYAAQGLTAYDSALRLGLRTIVADRMLPGKLDIVTTGTEDATAFARSQAATLDPQVALAEGYRRNNSGNFVEAAQFFDSLQQRADAVAGSDDKETASQRDQRLHEYAVNRALQLSNLGEFGQADTLFALARQYPVTDPVQVRLRRNFEAMHLLNQQRLVEALTVLDRSVAPFDKQSISASGTVELGERITAEINGSNPSSASLSVRQDTKLTPAERAAIIDAQALQLRGTISRLQGKSDEGRSQMARALEDSVRVRDGRVTSIARLRAQIMTEMALADEDQGNFASARGLFDNALLLLETTYPETSAVNNVRARLAAFLVRRGSPAEALALYRKVIASTVANQGSTTGLTNQIKPYFDLLSDGVSQNPALVEDLFLASQTLIRPGAADSMEVLARELQAGSGEGARLFRQSVTLSRDIERGRIELARLTQMAQQDSAAMPLLEIQQADLASLAEQQTATQAALTAFPQFRAVSKQTLSLADMQTTLLPGEAYFKLAVAGDAVYAIYADTKSTNGYRLKISASEMTAQVNALRDTISTWENGEPTTYPFDVALAHKLYLDLFAPVAPQLATAKHLIFEPDGAMLQLPVNLLVADQASVDTYTARVAPQSGDEFDFRGVNWLGRTTAVSTAISARSFRDARLAPQSAAQRQYLGFGNNAPAFAQVVKASTRGPSTFDTLDCTWPLTEWNKPIAATELIIAANLIGNDSSRVVTGTQFTDTAVQVQPDLNNYRILHFATHGLVTAPRVGCPARPALLTSIGGEASDGLLSFAEIFDLKIDADVVILSACDTAGKASSAATQEAGINVGGGSALDGLVRGFIGAGGRSVIASHWPAPDSFDATQRLMSGLFQTRGASVAEAMRQTQLKLMDDADTSHPFYWAGFAIVGDGARNFLGGN